jgi:hypothetical protein
LAQPLAKAEVNILNENKQRRSIKHPPSSLNIHVRAEHRSIDNRHPDIGSNIDNNTVHNIAAE